MIPKTQYAVQLTGPGQLFLNKEKTVHDIGPTQLLCKVSVVGLCFSDLKLLKQFDRHARKPAVTTGVSQEILAECPTYVPDSKPTVPGHETVVEVVAAGDQVTHYEVGKHYIVQTDWRWIMNQNTNAAFGYNFEGALQEYVLLDERIVVSPEGDPMLLPAPKGIRSAAAFALVEPWACVEEAYQEKQRQRIKQNGRLLVVASDDLPENALDNLFAEFGKPAEIIKSSADKLAEVADQAFDDIIYFGSDAAVAEALFAKGGRKAIFNFVQCGKKFGQPVNTAVGAVHYLGYRIIGTEGSDPAEAMRHIPATGEMPKEAKVNVVGAGGPMGVMHVIRDLCVGDNVTVYAADLNKERLQALEKLAVPKAAKYGTTYVGYNPKEETLDVQFDVQAIMAPVPALVAAAVGTSAPNAIIDIFAGIPADVYGAMDLDQYIAKHLYLIGTSGSLTNDMKIVLNYVADGKVDTNVSVAAVSGLDDALKALKAVEEQTIPGKIMVYPMCKGLSLTLLPELETAYPSVFGKLTAEGVWTKEAEEELLAQF